MPYCWATLLIDELVLHHVVGGLQQGAEALIDFALPGGGHFVVMALDVQADFHHAHHHLRAQVLEMIDGRGGEVAFLEARAIAQVVLVAAAVPASFVRIDVEEAVLRRGIEANAIEDEELRFGAEESLVGDASLFQVRLGADGDLPGIARVGLVRDGVADVADQHQRGRVAERIHEGGVGIGHQQHVRFVDRLPPADGTAVKAESILEGALFQFADGITHVLPQAGKIGESQIENFGVVLIGKF